MLESIYSTVDKAPLAGKFLIQSSVSNYITANESNEKTQFAKTFSLLGAMVVGHGYQTYLGYDTAQSHLETLHHGGSPADLLLSSFDSSYAFINAAVTIRQINLMKRITEIRAKKVEKFSNNNELVTDKPEKRKREYAPKMILGALALTLAGQAIFLGSSTDAEIKENDHACYETTADYYDSYVQENPSLEFIPEEEYVNEVCSN